MARGLISGLIVGSVVSLLGLSTLSLLSPLPPSPDISGVPGPVIPPSERAEQQRPQAGPDADLVELAPTAPSAAGGADDLGPLEESDTDPAARPSVGDAGDAPAAPATGPGRPEMTPAPGDDVPPAMAGPAPVQPGTDRTPEAVERDPVPRPEISAETGTIGPPEGAGTAPDLPGAAGGGAPAGQQVAAPVAPDAGEAGPDLSGTSPGSRPSVGGATDGLPSPSGSGSAPDVTAIANAPDARSSPGDGLVRPQDEEQPVSAQPAQPVAPDAGETGSGLQDGPAAAEPEQPPAPRIAALPQAGGESEAREGPDVGTRVKPLTERDSPAPRLPRVTDGAGTAGDAPEPAILRYAAAFENPDEKPLMSIALIDDESAFGAEALQEFPYPLTFVLDPSDPGALEKLERHRAAGFEVALLTDLPEAASPQDAEVALEAALAALTETVALFEGVQSGFQGNRPLSDQVTAIAAGTGRGLVTQSNGLNTVQKLAAREGVPSAVVFRDFDGAGQTPDTIRRFLDQAAFRADQEGAVVMLGRVRPDTISALLLWGLQDRANRVALAPLSAALLRNASE